MDAECERLDRERSQVRDLGFNKATHQSLFHAAHDIKGEAATIWLSGNRRDSRDLCRLLEHTSDMTRIPLALIDQHIDTMRAHHSRARALRHRRTGCCS